MINFYEYPVGVPFGDPNYDSSLGGSHDLTYQTPPNIPVIQLADGIISDISSPTWGKQICIKMDRPVLGHDYFAILHLSAIVPKLSLGEHIQKGTLVGWSGGATNSGQYGSTLNPTGSNFTNSPDMSSMLQTGIALHDGPSYGGLGWKVFPPIDMTLDPSIVVTSYQSWLDSQPVSVNYREEQAHLTWIATQQLLLTCYHTQAVETTGIHALWLKAYLAGLNMGPPLTPETDYLNWSGSPGVCQWFINGYRIEWINGQGAIYNGENSQKEL